MRRIGALLLACLPLWISCGRKPDLLWKFETGGYVYSSPAVAGQNLIIGSSDGYLYALDLHSGKLAWKVKLGVSYVGSPLLHAGSIIVGSDSGSLVSLDPSNGSVRWQFPTRALIHYTPCADDSGIYFGSQDGRFYKVTADGRMLWEFAAGDRLWATCVFYNDLVLTSSWDTNVYALEKSTGALRWKHSSGKINYGNAEILGNSAFYTSHQNFFRLEAATGKVETQTAFPYADYMLIWNNFLWVPDGSLSKRNLDGSEVGSARVRSAPSFRPVETPGFVIVGGTETLYGVSPELEVLWKYKTEDQFWAPGIVHDGIYYTGNRDRHVYALRLP